MSYIYPGSGSDSASSPDSSVTKYLIDDYISAEGLDSDVVKPDSDSAEGAEKEPWIFILD
eukprot:gene24933-10584_t